MAWPKLMPMNDYLREAFVEGTAPNPETMTKWIRENTVPGKKIGKRYFVYVGPDNQLMEPQTVDADHAVADELYEQWLKDSGQEAA